MKRLCIYVTYDLENIVDDYIGYMLKGLREVADCLVVICNSERITQGLENIRPYADMMYYRGNKGCDAGAHKDALCSYLGWKAVCGYDELWLVNDSLFGPMYPLSDLCGRMDREDCDYWGLVRSSGCSFGEFQYDAHIQSYFLAFRKTVLASTHFRKFWEELRYPESGFEAVVEFELGLNGYLERCGFRGIALTDMGQFGSLFKEGERPYLCYPLELLRDLKNPMLKRNSFSFLSNTFTKGLEVLKYLEEEKLYDIKLIKKHIIRRSPWGERILDFCARSEKLYFYGAGVCGKNLSAFFKYMDLEFDGFLVTDMKEPVENCRVFDDVRLSENDGIIIAVASEEKCAQILEAIGNRSRQEQILCPGFNGKLHA